jgi:hypothetical protein
MSASHVIWIDFEPGIPGHTIAAHVALPVEGSALLVAEYARSARGGAGYTQ